MADYHGTTPFTDDDEPAATFQGRVPAGVTATIVAVPFAGLGVAVWLAWGRGLNLADIPGSQGRRAVGGSDMSLLLQQAISYGQGRVPTRRPPGSAGGAPWRL